MRRRMIGVFALTAAVATACGGGEGGQTEVAELFVELAAQEGVVVDRTCVDAAVEGLSEQDAALIIEAGSDGSADISDGAEAIIEETQKCVDVGSYVASIVSQLEDASVDTDCLLAELTGAVTVDEINERIGDATLASAD